MKESQVAAHGLFLKASNQTGAPETRDRSNSALSDSFQTVSDLVLEGLQPSEICGLKMVKRQVVAGVVLITSSSRLPRRRSRSSTSFFFRRPWESVRCKIHSATLPHLDGSRSSFTHRQIQLSTFF
jgi:hypothetical protein